MSGEIDANDRLILDTTEKDYAIKCEILAQNSHSALSDIISDNIAQIFIENTRVIGIIFAPTTHSFTQVPHEWGKFTRLQSLKLKYIQPTRIPASFQDLVFLTDAAFENIASDSIIAHFHHWKYLTRFSIKNTPLPPRFAPGERLPSLKFLEFSHTQLHEIPKWVMDQPMLVGVNLSHNDIPSTSPLRHAYQSNWEVLDISHNPISDFSFLDTLTALRRINISYTNCQCFPPALLAIPDIIELNISHNSISNIPPNIMERWPNLYLLDLSFNKISEFPAFIFQGRLNFVNLAQNPLPAALGEFLQKVGLINETDESASSFLSPRLPPINRDMLRRFLKDDFFPSIMEKITNEEPLDEYDQIYPYLIQIFPLIDAKTADKTSPTFEALQKIYQELIRHPIHTKNLLL